MILDTEEFSKFANSLADDASKTSMHYFRNKIEIEIKELNNLLRPEDIDLLNQVEQLSTCESKLINKIKDLNYAENNAKDHIINEKKILPSNKVSFNKISSFMINWSNKFVVIALLTISAIALSKQAWA